MSVIVLAYATGQGFVSGPATTVQHLFVSLCLKRHDPSSSGLKTARLGALYTPPRLGFVPRYLTLGLLTKRASSLLCAFLKTCSPDI